MPTQLSLLPETAAGTLSDLAPPAPPTSDELVELARAYVGQARAPRTLRAYDGDWRRFTAWCDARRHAPHPAAPATVALYLTELAHAGRKLATLRRARASIAVAHRLSSLLFVSTTARTASRTRALTSRRTSPDDRRAAAQFHQAAGPMRYRYRLLIDAHDPRRIDVGLQSRFPITNVRTYRDLRASSHSYLYSRDCLQVTLHLGAGREFTVYINHFKSMIGGPERTRERRKMQADCVRELVETHWGSDLEGNFAVVGRLNDYMEPGVALGGLVRALLINGLDRAVEDERWTYYSAGENHYRQIDSILLRKALDDAPGQPIHSPGRARGPAMAGRPLRRRPVRGGGGAQPQRLRPLPALHGPRRGRAAPMTHPPTEAGPAAGPGPAVRREPPAA